ncbi:MAG: L,D-transpeptidase family protein [Thermodesulfovibrio sp.]|nr:L,D-transpeptidase family protein [Thermodesulfovibrio sp.]MDW7999120.1 L,D-transpeptidase family protein [Thermodesulfovibrio sp.]
MSFYKEFNFQPIWNEKRIETLKYLVKNSKYEGLNSKEYEINISNSTIENELNLTNTLIKLAYHTYYGRVNPSKVFERWDFPRKKDRVLKVLSDLIKQDKLEEFFEALSPIYKDYKTLKEYLRLYYEIESRDDGDRIELKNKLKPGDIHPLISKIRKRLYLTGYLDSYTESNLYDEKLEKAIKKFQELHNLESDSIIGKATIKALNMRIKDRILKIRINLEKYRWLPENLEDKYIWINIPSFELDLYESGQILMHSRIVVGKKYKEDFRPTPLLFSEIKQIVINPDWHIPYNIAVKDILPKIKKNPEYLINDKIKVFLNNEEVDPLKIDWTGIDEKNFNFKLVQKAGKKNALGKIKFHMPNNFDIYLHDTPQRKLFLHKVRTFSSGCIRVEKAYHLALLLIENNNKKELNEKKLKEALNSEQTVYINLKNSIPVYILYFTNIIKNSELYFLEDIYEYDKMIAKYLLN